MLVAAIAAFAAWFPSAASADITPTVTTSYEPSTVPGGNGLYSITQTYQYGGSPEPQPGTEDLKKWVIDSPAGLIGNPNAIPYDDRCTVAEFNQANPFADSTCPPESKVGTATLNLVTDAVSGMVPGGTPLTAVTGDIYVLQTDPEVPTTLATRLNSAWYQNVPTTPCASPAPLPCPVYIKTRSIVQPVTTGINGADDGDFRLRIIPAEDSTRPSSYLPTGSGFAAGATPLHIRSITYALNADAGNGNPFIQYPTNLGPWNSLSYATAWDANANADSDPDPDEALNSYKKSTNIDAKTPDQVLPPFPASASMTLSDLSRGSHPQVDMTVKGINAMGDDYPKSVVNTLPASINVDALNIPADVCTTAQRDANACPASSKIGTATAPTPLLTAGLSGDVYMVEIDGKTVPDLAIFFNNPPNSIRSFRLDGATKYVGAQANQIETTFANNPQNPINEFKMTINGGASGLMKVIECPSGSASPEDGPITFNLTGFSGQTAANSSTPALADCFGIAKLKKISKCVKSKLKVSPSYQSRDQISKAELWIKRKGSKKYKRVKTNKKSPFRFSVKLSKRTYKKGKHAYRIRAVYKASPAAPGGTVKTRTSSFKKC